MDADDTYDTLERIVPDRIDSEDLAGAASLALHVDRYRFAAEQALPGRLLDLACGVGYGTRLIADSREDISALLGVDLSDRAIDYARDAYAGGRLAYQVGDAMTFSDPEGTGFDTIVSLETIEHVPDPQAVFERLCGMLAPGGRLIASVPTTPSVDLNPHHLHDFTLASFREMGERQGLCEVADQFQEQRVGLAELLKPDRRFRRESLRPNLVAYYASHPKALLTRIATTLRHGLANHYRTIVWTREG